MYVLNLGMKGLSEKSIAGEYVPFDDNNGRRSEKKRLVVL